MLENIWLKEKNIVKLKENLNINNINDVKLYFWFDIAKDFHYLTILMEESGSSSIYDIWEIKNNFEWFKKLENIFNLLVSLKINKSNIFIWLEVTWSYYFSLVEQIKKIWIDNIYIINWSKIKQFKNSFINSKIKTDKQDSIVITYYINTFKNLLEKESDIYIKNKTNSKQINRSIFLETSRLKFLYRQYYAEKKSCSIIKSKIKELTNRIMPEIYQVFNRSKFSKMELYIKSNFTKEEICELSSIDFYKKVMVWSENIEYNKKSHVKKLEKLQNIMKNSIWIDDDFWIFKWQMKIFVEKYNFTKSIIENLEKLINIEIENASLFIPKIHWVWNILLWAFYSELWENLYKKDIKEVVGFIGRYPTEYSSWWKNLSRAKFQTRWNRILRKVSYLIALSMTRHCKEVKQLKEKIQNKKNIKAMEAMIITWWVLLRIVISLLKNKNDFDIEIFKKNYLS